MRTILLLLVLLPWTTQADNRAVEASGLIREWAGGRVGKPAANVLVSNGVELVRTDKRGRYRIRVLPKQTVFVIKPAAYESVVAGKQDGQFWRHHFPQGSPSLRYGGIETTRKGVAQFDFFLRPRVKSARSGTLDVLVFGDPQPKTTTQVDYYLRDIIVPLAAGTSASQGAVSKSEEHDSSAARGHAADLGLTLGDVVHDDLTLLPLIKQATARLGVPWLYAPGNHDLDFDAQNDEDSLLSYRRVFGPDTFAWEEPQASFILLDDVIYQPTQTPTYIGGLRESQFALLAAYLATLDPGKRLVIGAHIPLFDPNPAQPSFRKADRERLFALLSKFENVLLLTAHGHVQRHYYHAAKDGWFGPQPLHEYNVGATCGGFWTGAMDAEGIPDAVMNDGTPNGYATLSIAGDGRYGLRWQVARDPDHPGIALHAPRILRRGAWPEVGLYANVFMGMDHSVVEFRIDGGEWQPMQRIERADPRLLTINLADDVAEQLPAWERAPEAGISAHLWRVFLPTDLAAGEHQVEVRSFDPWRGELRASTRYRLLDR
ncbi:MAG: calcineurin-like phosphoesterase C-terminal domain-containing protein [Pseudomarimonas sp.]